MAFEDKYRLSCHAVITNDKNEVLLLKANYGDKNWGLPGGAIDPNETIHEALLRECLEELNCEVYVKYLSGVYFHSAFNSQAFIFRCEFKQHSSIKLSHEHTDYKYVAIQNMSRVQQHRINDCLSYCGNVFSAKF
ncbi:NUDIX domain-containing protein [Paraglaciecola aquimarina]|uniref:NUDIX domain-containing protein n=1 Tax=Paraglaciecola algarum TaxID=3050085 RepID=A0ABS9D4C5_9ALTE|nr:NUDIX domain-containing protein [Paraglaciecola sp. G1-23]MCF2946674.1 NUDIX domain-containing protein [Paraglaciecola sp. G1-23]